MTDFASWVSRWPHGHEREGKPVEVVPRELLSEAVERLKGISSGEEREATRERAACVVERVCERLESDDPVDATLAAQLRITMLNLIEMATR